MSRQNLQRNTERYNVAMVGWDDQQETGIVIMFDQSGGRVAQHYVSGDVYKGLRRLMNNGGNGHFDEFVSRTFLNGRQV